MKVLVIGLGSAGKKHMAALKKFKPEAEIYALRSQPGAEEITGVQNLFAWSDITFQPDFILISNPTGMHAETIRKALKFNCPLFIEKPLVSELKSALALQKKISIESIVTYTACNLRFFDCIRFVKKYLSENNKRINEVTIYAGSYLPDWRPGADFRKCYSANAEMGGGVHLDLIHELDYAYWLFGKPESVRKTIRSRSSLQISAPDFASYLLIYANFTITVTLNYYRKQPKRTIELVMEDAIWKVDLLKNTVTSGGKTLFQSVQTIQDTYPEQMAYFLDVTEKKEQLMNGLNESVEVLKICLPDA